MNSRWICVAAMICAMALDSTLHAASIIPRPVSVVASDGTFTLDRATAIIVDDAQRALGQDLADMITPATGFSPRIGSPNESIDAVQKTIRLKLDPALASLGDEGYRLKVSPGMQGVEISSSGSAGIFYGLQTLRQLFPPEIYSGTPVQGVAWTIPCVTIEDYPRFKWRGMMLDSARYFQPKDYVERFIDLMAMHKLNTFHWHLTDDQGWRIEIKKYPNLTKIGAWRKETLIGHADPKKPGVFDHTPYGGFYTQDDIRQVVKYAADRFITVVPEIEMPGHSRAAVASYPELGNLDTPIDVWTTFGIDPNILNPQESTLDFYKDVVSEVIDLFPSKFIHMGGDEAPTGQWDKSPAAQQRMRELHLAKSRDLQGYMISTMDKFLESKGRRMIGWDEILQAGIEPDTAVMSWRGVKGGIAAAQVGHDVVMAPSPFMYFNYYECKDTTGEPLSSGHYLPLKTVFGYEPIPPEFSQAEATRILGVQGEIWTPYVPTPQVLEHMVFPRECALSEVAWSPLDGKDFSDFWKRLDTHLLRLSELKVNYRKPKLDD